MACKFYDFIYICFSIQKSALDKQNKLEEATDHSLERGLGKNCTGLFFSLLVCLFFNSIVFVLHFFFLLTHNQWSKPSLLFCVRQWPTSKIQKTWYFCLQIFIYFYLFATLHANLNLIGISLFLLFVSKWVSHAVACLTDNTRP